MSWIVYMVRCSDKSLYTGITNNLNARLEKHNSGKGAKYTRSHYPVVLAYTEKVETKSKALKREIQIKKLKKLEKEQLVKNHIPSDMPEVYANGLAQTKLGWTTGEDKISRLEYQRKYSWAIPNEEALRTICEFSMIVEMGAGTGYWAKLLQNRGCHIACFDECPPGGSGVTTKAPIINVWHPGPGCFTSVAGGDPSFLDWYSASTLFLCWPPSANGMALECLKYWEGEFLIYVGNPNLTANKKFFNKLEKDFVLAHTVQIPNWVGIEDQMSVWRKKSSGLYIDVKRLLEVLGKRTAR